MFMGKLFLKYSSNWREICKALLFDEFSLFLADLLAEAIKGICIAEQKGLLKILDSWKEMQPVMEGLQLQQKQHTKKWIYRVYVSLWPLMGVVHASLQAKLKIYHTC